MVAYCLWETDPHLQCLVCTFNVVIYKSTFWAHSMFFLYHADGFSPFPSILTYFPDLDDSNLPPHWDMQQSLSDTSPTILLDAATGEDNSCLSCAHVTYFLCPSVCLSIRPFIHSSVQCSVYMLSNPPRNKTATLC